MFFVLSANCDKIQTFGIVMKLSPDIFTIRVWFVLICILLINHYIYEFADAIGVTDAPWVRPYRC